MQVFKTYFKLLKCYKGTLIIYFTLFLVISVVFVKNLSAPSGEQAFSSYQLDLAVIDRDKQTFGSALKTYFEGEHQFLEMEDDEDAILNELYWRNLDYVLVVPEGYEDSILDEQKPDMELQCIKIPGNYESSYFETELIQYTGRLNGLLSCGYSMEEAEKELENLKEKTVSVTMASFVSENQNDVSTVFFAFVPYLAISLGILGVGIILLQFNKQELKDRTECSAMPLRERVTGLTGGILAYGCILLLILLVTAAFLSDGSILTDPRLPYFTINMVAMILFGLSLGFLTGTIAKNVDAVNGIVNIVGLGLCFLGGVFVPLEFFSDKITKIAKFLPSYWYVVTNNTIGEMKEMTPKIAGEIFPQMGVIFGYALAIFAVTLVIVSGKRKRNG